MAIIKPKRTYTIKRNDPLLGNPGAILALMRSNPTLAKRTGKVLKTGDVVRLPTQGLTATATGHPDFPPPPPPSDSGYGNKGKIKPRPTKPKPAMTKVVVKKKSTKNTVLPPPLVTSKTQPRPQMARTVAYAPQARVAPGYAMALPQRPQVPQQFQGVFPQVPQQLQNVFRPYAQTSVPTQLQGIFGQQAGPPAPGQQRSTQIPATYTARSGQNVPAALRGVVPSPEQYQELQRAQSAAQQNAQTAGGRAAPQDRAGSLARTYTNMAYVDYAMQLLATIPAEDLKIEDFPLVIRPETALALGLDEGFLAELGYSNNNQYGYWVRPTATTNDIAKAGGGGDAQSPYYGYGGGGGWGGYGDGGGGGYSPSGRPIFGSEMGAVTWRI